jgi:DNA-binding MarR family transcriptional regulator
MAKVPKEAGEATELLFELLQDHKRSFATVAKEYGLTLQQTATLWNLSPGQGVAMSALAEVLQCDASNVTGIVDKLEVRGLAQRGQAEDRRVKVLTLTAAGEELKLDMRKRMMQPRPWMLALSRDDQRMLRDILQRGVAALKPDES